MRVPYALREESCSSIKDKAIQIQHHIIRDIVMKQRLINRGPAFSVESTAQPTQSTARLRNPHSRAASSPRDAQGTPAQSATQDSSLQGTAKIQGTADSQGTAEIQGTADFQGTTDIQGTADFQGAAETQGAADIPQSPNDYTPTDASQTSGGDEGLLDLYDLNREVRRLKKQNISQAKQIHKLNAKLKKLSKGVNPLVKHHILWVKSQKLKKKKSRYFEKSAQDRESLEAISERKSDEQKRCLMMKQVISSPIRPNQEEELKEQFHDPTQATDPKEKGKWILVEEPKKKKLTLQQIRALETKNDEEVARIIQAEWDAEEERKRKESNDEFLKGSRIQEFAKTKVSTNEGTQSTQDRESLEAISMITEFKVIDSPDGEYLIIFRANNHFGAFNTLWEILHILDRQDLHHLYLVVQDYYKHIPPTGLGLILLGDLTTIWETSTTSNDDFWKNQEDWEITCIDAERRCPTIKKLEVKLVEFKLGENCWEIRVRRKVLEDTQHNETQKPLLKDEDGEEVDVHMYRSMIGSLMYLISSRLDIMFVVCTCARYQVNPKVSHLHAVKRIFRYLKGQPKFGLWYPKDSPFDLVAYTDSDYARASLDRKFTT
ncbi:hypothetical protein Tco_0663788 [Tanacetum coccineum]